MFISSKSDIDSSDDFSRQRSPRKRQVTSDILGQMRANALDVLCASICVKRVLLGAPRRTVTLYIRRTKYLAGHRFNGHVNL